ncbi:MAG: LamG-like jellyroll fold domain-containing protein [Planctomycetota bacterium]
MKTLPWSRPLGGLLGLAAVVWIAACVPSGLAEETAPANPKAKTADKAEERFPVPPAAALAGPEQQIKEAYKEDYKKKGATEQAQFARKLLALAAESKNEVLTYYAALREARDAAFAAGDIELACAAIDLLAQTFLVDAGELKAGALATAGRNPATPEAAEKVFSTGLSVLDQLARDGHFDSALKLIPALEDAVRRANNAEHAGALQARAKEIRAQQAEYAKVKPQLEKLKANPDDPEAAAAVGKYYVAARNDWEQGLPLLAKSAAPALKDAAAKDLLQPEDAAARADLGDLWSLAAEKEFGPLKAALQHRALDWYSKAVGELSGFRKLQVEKKIQTALGASGMTLEGLRAAGLVFWVNPNLDPAGKPRDLVSNTPATNNGTVPIVTDEGLKALKFNGSSDVSYPVSDAVRAIKGAGSGFVWIKIEKSAQPHPNVLFRGCGPGPGVGGGYADFTYFLQENKLLLFFNYPENGGSPWASGLEGKTAFFSKRALPYGKWGMFGASWDGTTISIYFNGERDNTYKSALTPLKRKGPDNIVLGDDPAGTPEYFTGLTHSAMLFNRALTDAEVKQLYVMSGIQGK